MIVIFRGLPGTGKSHLVRGLVAQKPGFLVLSRDSLRVSIVPAPTFAPDEKSLIDDLVVRMAGFLLERGRDVVIDGMALSSAARVEQLAREAETRGAAARVSECVCAESTALARIGRDTGAHPAGDRGERLYFDVKARFEPLARACLTVQTDGDAGPALARILAYLAEEAG